MSYAINFPAFPAADIPAFVQSTAWEDQSFYNEGAPFFLHTARGLGVWVNIADASARFEDEPARFTVTRLELAENLGWQHPIAPAILYSGEDEAEALAVLIGEAFADNLRAYIRGERFAIMQWRNVSNPGTGICASHDFCDANVFMADAFESITGKAPVLCSDVEEGRAMEAQQEAETALWNAAWAYAKREHLTASV